MSGEVNSGGQPKTPLPKHRHSRSAVAVRTEDGQPPNQTNQRSNRRHREQKQGPGVPAWQDSAPSPDATGDFDSDGNFISTSGPNGSQVYDNDSPTERGSQSVPRQKNRRKQRVKREQNQNPKSQPYTDVAPIPPREAPLHTQVLQNQVPNSTQTPAKSTAYAGPTFHASPAASALPIPKFLSKSVPPDTPQSSLQARLEQEKESSDKSSSPPREETVLEEPAPTNPSLTNPSRTSESPLDFFFKAHREEKACISCPLLLIMFNADRGQKARGTGAGTQSTPNSKPITNIPQSEPTPPNHWSKIYGTDQRHHIRQSSSGSGRDLFMMELDGNSASSFNVTPPRDDRTTGLHKFVTAPTNLLHQNSEPFPSEHVMNQQIYISPNFGKSMPSLPNIPPNASHTGTPFDQSQHYQVPRSAGSTPAPQSNNPYHYGNKNLSPLFQAARNDNFRRSSSLRQELRPEGSVELPANQPPYQFTQTQSQIGGIPDPSSVARGYLQSHLGQEVRMPDIDLSKFAAPNGPQQAPYAPIPQPSFVPSPSPMQSGRTHPGDVRSMEDDLRRLLNLNVPGGNGNQ